MNLVVAAEAAGPSSDSVSGKAWSRRLLAILALALLLRAAWGWWIPVVPQSDVMAYDIFARNLLNHGVFGFQPDQPFSYWPPGTSMFYAAVYWLGGLDYRPVVIANLAVALGTIYCTARIVSRLLGPAIALWCAALLAVWPTMVMMVTLLLSEQLFLFFTVAALDVWTARGHPLRRGAWAGLLLGAASLVRPVAPLLPFLFALCTLLHAGWRCADVRAEQWRLLAMSVLAMAVVIAPWTWRNYQLLDGQFVLISNNGGVNLWMGNAPEGDGFMRRLPDSVKGMSDYEADRYLGQLARQYILADPVAFAGKACLRLVNLYSNESSAALWNAGGISKAVGESSVNLFKRTTQITWAGIFGLALAGLALLSRTATGRRVLLSPMMGMVALTSLIHAVVVTGDRYHLAIAAQIAMLSAVALDAGWRRWKRGATSPGLR